MQLRPSDTCDFDVLALGEVMLRLDPGEGRVRTARGFSVWEGGGEYNVARGLRKCFGLRAGIATALVDNEVGRLLEDLMMQGGVDTSSIKWLSHDGLGRSARNGLNFTERGFGLRGAVGCVDRGNTAATQLRAGDIDWDHLFGERGVRWFHTGGIFAAVSDTAPELIIEALRSARKHGTVTSYDLNYRASLWEDFGGMERCQQVNRTIAPLVDVMIGNGGHLAACLGVHVDDLGEDVKQLSLEGNKRMIEQAARDFPNFQVIATTLRKVKSASVNDWGAICWSGDQFHESRYRLDLEILDRVGAGDSYASGLIYGFLTGDDAGRAVEYGAAHGALAMTTPGDTSMATKEEVEALIVGQSASVKR